MSDAANINAIFDQPGAVCGDCARAWGGLYPYFDGPQVISVWTATCEVCRRAEQMCTTARDCGYLKPGWRECRGAA